MAILGHITCFATYLEFSTMHPTYFGARTFLQGSDIYDDQPNNLVHPGLRQISPSGSSSQSVTSCCLNGPFHVMSPPFSLIKQGMPAGKSNFRAHTGFQLCDFGRPILPSQRLIQGYFAENFEMEAKFLDNQRNSTNVLPILRITDPLKMPASTAFLRQGG